MKAASEDTSYGFADGRVRALENTLLDRQRYDRLVRTGSVDEFRAALADTIYGRFLAEEGGTAVEQALTAAESDNNNFFEELCHDDWVLEIFRGRRNFYDLKVAVKNRMSAHAGDTDNTPRRGNWTREQIGALAAGEEDAGPAAARDAVRELLAQVDPGPAEVDSTLDRAEQEYLLFLSGESAFIAGYLGVHADVENLRAYIRARVTPEETGSRGKHLLPGGTIPEETILALWSEEPETAAARMRQTPYGRMLEEGIDAIHGGSLLRFERYGREHKLNHLHSARYLTFGYEPLVAYYLFRENEITNVRLLHAAKKSGLEENQCREMVAYVE